MAPVETAPAATSIRVEVVYGVGPGQVDSTALQLAAGSRVVDAVAASGVLGRHGLATDSLLLGVWNRAAAAETPLRDGDRVEIHRPLQVDPKEARRQRHARQMPPRRLRRDG
jgi:putative ubiquitin-RnfH superfamily antitoxin RatB of RatAB toxin-antitoxin module